MFPIIAHLHQIHLNSNYLNAHGIFKCTKNKQGKICRIVPCLFLFDYFSVTMKLSFHIIKKLAQSEAEHEMSIEDNTVMMF
jgi:hypothetical protein